MVIRARWIIFLTLAASTVIRAAEASEWQLVRDSSNVRFIGVVEGSAFRGRFEKQWEAWSSRLCPKGVYHWRTG